MSSLSATDDTSTSDEYPAPCFSPVFSTSSGSCTTEEDASDIGTINQTHGYKIVGDNIDKVVKPRYMRVDHQSKSLHYFHSYAVRDRIDFSQLSDECCLVDPDDIDVSSVLPTSSAQEAIKENFGILVARILKKHMPFFSRYASALERHIPHEYSKELSAKSEVVSV